MLHLFTMEDDSSRFVASYKRLFIFIVWLPNGGWNTIAKDQRIDRHSFSIGVVDSQ